MKKKKKIVRDFINNPNIKQKYFYPEMKKFIYSFIRILYNLNSKEDIDVVNNDFRKINKNMNAKEIRENFHLYFPVNIYKTIFYNILHLFKLIS